MSKVEIHLKQKERYNNNPVSKSDYEKIWSGEIPDPHSEVAWRTGQTYPDLLNDIYTMFNVDHPKDYQDRSLSVGDRVNLDGELWEVMFVGFEKAEFLDWIESGLGTPVELEMSFYEIMDQDFTGIEIKLGDEEWTNMAESGEEETSFPNQTEKFNFPDRAAALAFIDSNKQFRKINK